LRGEREGLIQTHCVVALGSSAKDSRVLAHIPLVKQGMEWRRLRRKALRHGEKRDRSAHVLQLLRSCRPLDFAPPTRGKRKQDYSANSCDGYNPCRFPWLLCLQRGDQNCEQGDLNGLIASVKELVATRRGETKLARCETRSFPLGIAADFPGGGGTKLEAKK
jgi:hypothetical protein